jgi:hypothetical protein
MYPRAGRSTPAPKLRRRRERGGSSNRIPDCRVHDRESQDPVVETGVDQPLELGSTSRKMPSTCEKYCHNGGMAFARDHGGG